jgi:hypothetical protein
VLLAVMERLNAVTVAKAIIAGTSDRSYGIHDEAILNR